MDSVSYRIREKSVTATMALSDRFANSKIHAKHVHAGLVGHATQSSSTYLDSSSFLNIANAIKGTQARIAKLVKLGSYF